MYNWDLSSSLSGSKIKAFSIMHHAVFEKGKHIFSFWGTQQKNLTAFASAAYK